MSAESIKELVRRVSETESRYLLHGDRHDPVVTPWMPYQPADFIGIVWECMPELSGNRFLDVGCGPGTKVRIAQGLFGLAASGIEIDLEMAVEASTEFGPNIVHGDALAMSAPYYEVPDLIWLYRPFRDSIRERALETLIIESMKPGAVLAGGSWETDVPALGWQTIVDDTLTSPDGSACIWRGAWQKPKTTSK